MLAVDLPGFGASPAIADDVVPTPAALAGALAELLDRLGLDRVDVVGNSLGGWVAIELARAHRARTATAIAPAGFWGRPLGPRPGLRVRELPRPLRRALPWLVTTGPARRLGLAAVVAHPERVPAGAARRIVGAYLEAPGFEAVNAAMRADFVRVEDLAEIGAPITLAWGDRDRLVTPPHRPLPGVRSVALPGCGHMAMWDAPERVADLILESARARVPA